MHTYVCVYIYIYRFVCLLAAHVHAEAATERVLLVLHDLRVDGQSLDIIQHDNIIVNIIL